MRAEIFFVDELSVLMAKSCRRPAPDSSGSIERLAIFGTRTGRTGAELKVMAAIETKIPGYYTRDVGDSHSNEEWGQDTLPLGNEELSFALGKDPSRLRLVMVFCLVLQGPCCCVL